MKRPGSFWFAIGALALVAGVGAGMLASEHAPLPACATEDSDNCHWDAVHQGNGSGRSFDVIHGEVTYTP